MALWLALGCSLALAARCEAYTVRAHSAILIDASDGSVLFEQQADRPIAPASVTKIMTLYLTFDAIKEGQVHLWDRVSISRRAAETGGSRMGLKAGTEVPLEELIKGVAVVSGNDAAVAVAEHVAGSVENFVRKMNLKCRMLGMYNTTFMTPNGLPAKGQLSTARDLARLSISYLRRHPEALHLHSMTSYTYGNSTHHNANKLLGTCPGVDGIKTGFVCASGYNLAATAKRGDVRLIAVVMGASSASIRAIETEKLLEAGFQKALGGSSEDPFAPGILVKTKTTNEISTTRLSNLAESKNKPQARSTGIRQPSLDQRVSSKGSAATSKKAASSCTTLAKKEPTGDIKGAGTKVTSSVSSKEKNASNSPIASTSCKRTRSAQSTDATSPAKSQKIPTAKKTTKTPHTKNTGG